MIVVQIQYTAQQKISSQINAVTAANVIETCVHSHTTQVVTLIVILKCGQFSLYGDGIMAVCTHTNPL